MGSLAAGICLTDRLFPGLDNLEAAPVVKPAEIVVVKGTNPEEITARAVEGIGGIQKYVRKGARVVIKPNIGWDRTVEQGANTHPAVVKSLVKLCRRAGASEVVVLDNTCNPWNVTYLKSGIADAVKEAGGVMKPPARYRKVAIPGGQVLKEADILEEILEADVFINAPVCKVHGSQARVTLAMKNLMGIVKDRGFFHRADMNQCIVDIAAHVKPAFTVLDATRILLTNGPAGPGTVKELNTVAAGTDFVALDAYGATLLGVKPETVRHIKIAGEIGLGEAEIANVKIRTL